MFVDQNVAKTPFCSDLNSLSICRKDFAAADGLAKELQDLGIAYLDDKREWYTKVVVQKKPEAAAAASSEEGSAKRKRDDSSKPAIEVSTEGVDGVDDDDAPTSSDDDSEDDREDDAFVARMEAKLMVGDKKLKSEVSTPGPTKKAAAVAGDSTPKTTKSAKKQKK